MHSQYPTVTVVEGTNQSAEIVLDHTPIVVGRGHECDVTLQDHYASRHHCWIEQGEDERWRLRDLSSKNGTLLNGERVAGVTPLSDGAIISIGRSQLRFTDPLDTQTKTFHLVPALSPTIVLDLARHTVSVAGNPLDPSLSPKQWLLLALFWENRGDVVTKDQIAQSVWPEAKGDIYDYQIDKLVSRLRMRLGDAGDELIETVWGFGYRLL